jgi:hypothetical protein
MKLFSVQSDPKRSVIAESSAGTTHHGGAHVPNVQTKCTAGCDRLHPSRNDHNHTPTFNSAKVRAMPYILAHCMLVII